MQHPVMTQTSLMERLDTIRTTVTTLPRAVIPLAAPIPARTLIFPTEPLGMTCLVTEVLGTSLALVMTR